MRAGTMRVPVFGNNSRYRLEGGKYLVAGGRGCTLSSLPSSQCVDDFLLGCREVFACLPPRSHVLGHTPKTCFLLYSIMAFGTGRVGIRSLANTAAFSTDGRYGSETTPHPLRFD